MRPTPDVLARYTERLAQRTGPPVVEKYQAQRESFERQQVAGRTTGVPAVGGRSTSLPDAGVAPSRATLAPVIARYNQVMRRFTAFPSGKREGSQKQRF